MRESRLKYRHVRSSKKNIYVDKSDGAERAGEEKERKTEVKMGRQHQASLD